MATAVHVMKLTHDGHIKHQYAGEIVAHGDTWVQMVARFGLDVVKDYVHFRRGDLMTEWHYTDRWYNIFRINDVDDGRLKGWYCNVTRPAVINWGSEPVEIKADDLELDVFVSPTGEFLLLDEDEFAEIEISDVESRAAWLAVDELRRLVAERAAPFDEIV